MTPTPTAPVMTPQLTKVRRFSRLFVWTLIATWLLSSAPMIYRLGTLPLALVAAVFGAIAFWSTFGVPNMVSLRVMLGLGGVGVGLFALWGMAWLAIAPEVLALDACERSSLTPQGDLVCQQEFHAAVKSRYGVEIP